MRRALMVALIMRLSLIATTRGAAAAEASVEQASLASPSLRATAVRLAGDERRTRLVLDLSGPVTFRAFALGNPMRVVVDLPAVAFALPAGTGQVARGLVSGFRYGGSGPGRSRLVVDLAGAAAIDRTFVIPGSDDQPTRLVLDLVRSDSAGFERTLAAGHKVLDAPAPTEVQSIKSDRLSAPALPVVVIDPGHGGIDAGATSPSGEQEKAIVLGFARRIQQKLADSGRYRAVLTREGDSFITLSERVRLAREAHAALFISIHADTLPDPFGVRGATIYTLSDTASDADTARYAEKENRADLMAGANLSAETDDVADILFELTRRETKAFSNQFAKVLATDFAAASPLNKNAHRSAGFRVLTAPDVPSVLLELGYLSNAQDLKLMTSGDWSEQASGAVATAVDAFFKLHGRGRVGSPPGLPEVPVAGMSVVKAAVSP